MLVENLRNKMSDYETIYGIAHEAIVEKGKYAATLIIAASNSLHPDHANYICDGVDDQVEIQAAIDALPSIGGTIYLSEGAFYINDTINVQKPIVFRGAGVNWSTDLYPDDYAGTMLFATSTLENTILNVFGNSYFGALYEIGFCGNLHSEDKIENPAVIIKNKGDYQILHCGFFEMRNNITLSLSNHGSWIQNCDFEDSIFSDTAVLFIDERRNWITNCHFARNKNDICISAAHQQFISNCDFKNTINDAIVILADDVWVTNSHFITVNGKCIKIDGSAFRTIITGNIFTYFTDTAIYLIVGGLSNISNNIFAEWADNKTAIDLSNFNGNMLNILGNQFHSLITGNRTGIDAINVSTNVLITNNIFKRIDNPIVKNFESVVSSNNIII